MGEKASRTLILVCHRDFCRILEHLLLHEGLKDFQHGDLSLIGGVNANACAPESSEVFVVPADADQAARLVALLQFCPLRDRRPDALFELYVVDNQ